jgi:AcrR family transcriptional regulator
LTVLTLGRRERKKIAAREKICDETIGLIELHGIEGLTIDAICDCADIAKKTFYNYYSSKQDLLVDICHSSLLSRTEELINDALTRETQLTAQLQYIFSIMRQRVSEAGRLDKELIDFMVGNLSSNRSQGASQLTFMNDCFLRLYSNSRADLKPPLTAEFCAEMTVGMINALALNWLHDEHFASKDKHDQLLDFILNSMLNP